MNDKAITQEKAHEAIELLKEAVLTVLPKRIEGAKGLTIANVRDKLKLGKDYFPVYKEKGKGNWGTYQAVRTALVLLTLDELAYQVDNEWFAV